VLHQRFADWLEVLAGERTGEYDAILGYHLEQAFFYRNELGLVDEATRGLGERAAGFLAAAGRRALERGDSHAAVNLVERALSIGLTDPRERILNQLELVDALGAVGRSHEREPIVAEALVTAKQIGDQALLARARVSETSLTMWEADADLAAHQRVIEEAMRTLEELGDEVGLLRALRIYGQTFTVQGRSADAIAAAERTLAMAEARSERRVMREAAFSLAYATGGMNHVDAAIRRCVELRRAWHDDRLAEALIARCLARHVAMAGSAREARELVAHAERVLAELDPGRVGPYFSADDAAGGALRYAGDRAGAKDWLRLSWLTRSRQSAKPDGRAVRAALELALMCCEDGEWDEIERFLAVGEGDSGTQSAVRLAVRARLAAHHNRHPEASALATQAVEASQRRDNPHFQARMWANLADVRRAGGDERGADAATETARELFERFGNVAGAAMLRPRATSASR
jgi:tetratricopeptide (TPR) repeat protein